MLEHRDNVLIVKVLWDLLLDLRQLVIHCIEKHQGLRRLLGLPNFSNDSSPSEVFKYIKYEKRYSKLE